MLSMVAHFSTNYIYMEVYVGHFIFTCRLSLKNLEHHARSEKGRSLYHNLNNWPVTVFIVLVWLTVMWWQIKTHNRCPMNGLESCRGSSTDVVILLDWQ